MTCARSPRLVSGVCIAVLVALAALAVVGLERVVLADRSGAPGSAEPPPDAEAPVFSAGAPGAPAQARRRADRARTEVARASAVLHAWDRERARAYARGDAPALRRLYLPGCPAGMSDLALLREYRSNGYHVRGLRMQLLRLVVLQRTPGHYRLRVTDRVHRALAVSEHNRVLLPRDRSTTRVLDLRRPSPNVPWRVAAVSEP